MMSALGDPHLKRDIENLEQKREVLQQVIKIAQAIEHMHESLDSVLVLGVPSADMPACAMETYDSISANLKSLPATKLKEYLENLERIVKGQLNRILGYAGIDFDSDDGIEILTVAAEGSEQTPLQLLEDFRRTAQTTVSLRVLLRKRGVATPGTQFTVPKAVIEKQLDDLKEHEHKQRTRIGDRIGEMRDDVGAMLAKQNMPDPMKAMLRDVDARLAHDAAALAKGAPLNKLAFVADAEEIIAVDAVAPSPVDAAEEIIIGDVPPPAEDSAPVAKKKGFGAKANAWLNSSWDVSWEDVESK